MTLSKAKEYVEKLLKHYPFVYCPVLAAKTSNKTPHKGDIVLFYKGTRYSHTGYVYKVDGGKFYTIEGNTSAGESVIPNGGGVCLKSYKTADYSKAKFYRADYSILVKDKLFDSTEDVINAIIATAKAEVGYLEKKSNSNLDSKTGNAGQNNYTKYWKDIKPSYQGNPWCACFVTWIHLMTIYKKSNKTTSASSSTTSTTTTTKSTVQKGIVTASVANVRQKPNVNASKCTSDELKNGLKKDTVVTIKGSEKDSRGVIWYLIEHKGKKGYVSSKLVKKQ